MDVDSVQAIYKIPARFPLWPDIQPLFKSESEAGEMFARLSCFPALSHATVIPVEQGEVKFRVGLDVHAGNEEEWEVELWHEFDELKEWKGIGFAEVKEKVFDIGQLKSLFRRMYFALSIAKPTSLAASGSQFTIRFRQKGSNDWKWASDQFGLANGTLYWQSPTFDTSKSPQKPLSDFIQGVDSSIDIVSQSPETKDTLLWSLSIPTSGAIGQDSAFADHKLGVPLNYTRWFTTARLYSPWLQPLHGNAPFRVEKDVVEAAFLRHDGLSVVALAISGINNTSVMFRDDGEGNVIIKSRNDGEAAEAKVLVAVAKSYEIANCAVFYHARHMTSLSNETPSQTKALEKEKDGDVEASWFEEWYDGFGFCTWNSLGQQLNEQKILDALKSFRDDGISITTLIVDDNWQSLDQKDNQGQKGMVRFEADKECFPNGLKETMARIKRENPLVQRIAVWHTLLGYWGAISPTGELAQKYKTVKAANQSGWQWTCIHPDDIGKFYDEFYAFLSSCGVDGVKTDAQNMLDDLRDAPERRTMIKSYQDAWVIAGLRHMRARQIGCGSQCPVIMFHSMIPDNSPRIIVRNSDDFFPTVESSHSWHIFCNAHNSLFMQHLHVLPDWDMFQTNHPWAWYHAAARCISGGPIYITDYPQQHDKDLIKQMTGNTPRGSTVIFRPSRLAKTSEVYTSYDEPKLLKLTTYHGAAATGVSILGVFNVCKFTLSEVISLSDFPGTEEGTYIIRSHVKGFTSSPIKRPEDNSYLHIDLEKQGYDILTAFPLLPFKTDHGKLHIANLGLLGKMSGAAAIVAYQALPAKDGGRQRLYTTLKALGTWGVWIDALPTLSVKKDLFALMFGKPVPLHCVKVSETDERVLEVDLERTWNEGEFSQTWSNEVAVELFLP